ncbi:LAETG motif-containing sortase-dependent surface protein [Streptomyces sp. JW3]|uniref:LAETG motif-containing sortase-dependent surface protein n=1 Tax=Streptomyces sp. JW3 TaxID=3456955 RepID=UPI003FA43933
MAAAAVTAVIAPVALLAAPVAYADGETSASPSTSASVTSDESTSPDPSTSTTETAPGENTTSTSAAPADDPGQTSSTSASPTEAGGTSPNATESEDPEESQQPDPEPTECVADKVDSDITGLPGKIAAGSGWHEFSLTVENTSDTTIYGLGYLVSAASNKAGDDLFTSRDVRLQAFDPEGRTWYDLDEYGYAIGYAGMTEELKPGYEAEVPLRVNVAAGAPTGAAFTIGSTLYADEDLCFNEIEVAYKFQIVAAGTDTSGTKPQEGGKVPVTTATPSAGTPQVTGNLAETGSSSALPMVGLVGGFAVVAGAGAVFAVRRRKAGVEA